MSLISIPITGTPPGLLQHNPLGMSTSGRRLKPKEIPTAEEEAEAAVYWTPEGTIYHPAGAFKGCLISAAKGRRIGKTAATTVIKGAVFVPDDQVPLADEAGELLADYQIDMRRVVVQRQGIVRARPLLPKWNAVVSFEIEDDFITADQVRSLLEIGGRTVGVGDYRPEKGGPFGRFTLS